MCSPRPYRRFSYSFRPRGESATFLFATMILMHPDNKIVSFAAVGNSPPFLTNLPFHDFPNYFNQESWFTMLQFWENHEKAGLSKMGMSCRRLTRKVHFGLSTLPKSLLFLLSPNLSECSCLLFHASLYLQNLRLGGVTFRAVCSVQTNTERIEKKCVQLAGLITHV